MVDRIATDVFAPDDTLPRDLSYFRVCPFPDCSVPGCSKVAPIPPASETLRYERSSASTSMVHLTKSTARNDIHISRAHSGGTAVAGFKYRPIRPSTHRINASDRTLNGLISRQICSTQPNKSPPPLTSLTARPTKPRKVVSQPISVAANVVATMENGGRSRGSPIIISAATKPASGPTGTIHDLQRKRNFSSEGTDEVASKNLYDRAAPLMKSDQVSSSDDQSTVQPPPKMPRTISTAKLGAGPGKRSIHNKAKVQINMYIKNKEGLFVLWPFGLLHDKSSEDVCAKIAAEYKRPIGSIVFELIAGGTVTSVEIELSGDEGYQRLDQKVREMVRTCKHGGTIQIIVDPQTPEGADPSWEYDPLQFSEVCLDLMSTCRNRVGALSMNHCGVHSGLGFSTCPQYRKSTALGPQ
ncbi:hypothetical protein MMC17_005547 [Xylographa soralifera]|nr:hypothetical protein [Xylographa soralifera]